MTYQVLLVDDEPIILSGIKFMIDWEKNDCVVIGTARNGRQALDAIEQLRPDIVICDINMPVLSGIEVLQASMEKSAPPVFIILTNLEEFDLARQAMRYKAVDYLVKTQLEPETLERSLRLAKQECARRGSLARVRMVDSYLQSNKSQVVSTTAKKLLAVQDDLVPQGCIEALDQQDVLGSYLFMQLMLDFSALPTFDTFSDAERDRLYAWEQEVVEKLAGNVFRNYAAFDPDDFQQSLVLLCWDVPENAQEILERFYAKLCTASNNITQTRLSLLATEVLHGGQNLGEAVRQLSEAREYYYLTQCDCAYYGMLPPLAWQTIQFDDFGNRLVPELRTKNIAQCSAILNKAKTTIREVAHKRADALHACATLYSVASIVLPPMIPEGESGNYFGNNAAMVRQIRRFTTRSEVLAWMDEFEHQVTTQLEQLTSNKSDFVEKAKRYVQENVDKRIMLQDVADHVNISPSYLSALFKKEYNQNFVDYINATKMERACALIREGKYRVYEISYMLGFENSYYFTKVFKRNTGLTPTEYQHKVRSGNA